MTTETALQNFEDIKSYINDLSSLLGFYLDEYNSITDNPEEKKQLTENITQSYFYIEEIKEAMKNFDKEDNKQYVNDVVNIYLTKLKPLLLKISELKYKENYVYYDDDNATYNLMQNKTNIQSLEFTDYHNRILNYDIGLKAIVPASVVKTK